MSMQELLPLAVLFSSLVPGWRSSRCPNPGSGCAPPQPVWRLRQAGPVFLLLAGVAAGDEFGLRYAVLPGLDLVQVDALGMLFITLSAILYCSLRSTPSAISRSAAPQLLLRFLQLCVTATMGIAMAANLFILSSSMNCSPCRPSRWSSIPGPTRPCVAGPSTWPIRWLAARPLLTGIVWLHHLLGHSEFAHAASPLRSAGLGRATEDHFPAADRRVGVKAALVPLHGWLPQTMVALAPVSALLHAVAVVKAGAFGIVRIVYEVYGIEFAQSLNLLPLAVVAAVTIVWGSFRALFQDDLKRRLAFSTVSQVSTSRSAWPCSAPLAPSAGWCI